MASAISYFVSLHLFREVYNTLYTSLIYFKEHFIRNKLALSPLSWSVYLILNNAITHSNIYSSFLTR